KIDSQLAYFGVRFVAKVLDIWREPARASFWQIYLTRVTNHDYFCRVVDARQHLLQFAAGEILRFVNNQRRILYVRSAQEYVTHRCDPRLIIHDRWIVLAIQCESFIDSNLGKRVEQWRNVLRLLFLKCA